MSYVWLLSNEDVVLITTHSIFQIVDDDLQMLVYPADYCTRTYTVPGFSVRWSWGRCCAWSSDWGLRSLDVAGPISGFFKVFFI